jgi:hypothetical protein
MDFLPKNNIIKVNLNIDIFTVKRQEKNLEGGHYYMSPLAGDKVDDRK